MKLNKIIIACLIVQGLSGCEALHPPEPGKNPDYAPTYPATPDPKELK